MGSEDGHGSAPGGVPNDTTTTEPRPQIADGRYLLDARLGGGGTADVFRGLDTRLNRPVAVKLFRPGAGSTAENRFREEAQLLGPLEHPSLVTVYDAGVEKGRAYVVLQLIDGVTLASRLMHGPLSITQMVEVAARLADVLAYVHGRGIVHRDIKPSNVLVDENNVYLADFGISRLLGTKHNTATGLAVGTAAYMAPEQVRGLRVGPAADVYSLGLVLLECLTGRVEYPGGTVEAAIARLSRRPRISTGLPAPVRHVLVAMTENDPERRPTAAQCASALAKARLLLETEAVRQPAPRPSSAGSSGAATRSAAGAAGASGAPVASAGAAASAATPEAGVPEAGVPEAGVPNFARRFAARAGRAGRGAAGTSAAGAGHQPDPKPTGGRHSAPAEAESAADAARSGDPLDADQPFGQRRAADAHGNHSTGTDCPSVAKPTDDAPASDARPAGDGSPSGSQAEADSDPSDVIASLAATRTRTGGASSAARAARLAAATAALNGADQRPSPRPRRAGKPAAGAEASPPRAGTGSHTATADAASPEPTPTDPQQNPISETPAKPSVTPPPARSRRLTREHRRAASIGFGKHALRSAACLRLGIRGRIGVGVVSALLVVFAGSLISSPAEPSVSSAPIPPATLEPLVPSGPGPDQGSALSPQPPVVVRPPAQTSDATVPRTTTSAESLPTPTPTGTSTPSDAPSPTPSANPGGQDGEDGEQNGDEGDGQKPKKIKKPKPWDLVGWLYVLFVLGQD
jgi:hypothetical protein